MQTIIVVGTAFLSIVIYINVGGEKIDKSSKYRQLTDVEFVSGEPEFYSDGETVSNMLAEFKKNDKHYKIRMDEDDYATLVAGVEYNLVYKTRTKSLKEIDVGGQVNE